ncbi:(d)CMP kinase [Stratiformator vulcanicus]|uniref:Cytidylate kinase n=1 Tax=Stratiformator vulcanicus TaxID=2527980 RepID=A0A517R061_9PLAN|nr:(d)CMP kinase [Stratiformator vulcanicus]QDT37271.1 Cytidylate kinase [Stratiformator vulcanicus]
MIITIDGPAGSGKSTAARLLAERLGFEFLNTGAMYRAIAFRVLAQGIDPSDDERVVQCAESAAIRFEKGRLTLDGDDITDAIQSESVSLAASQVAVNPAVREVLVGLQRRAAEGKRMVSEGRDQGTVVFPGAEAKFFLTATAECRARRRQAELAQRGEEVEFESLLATIRERDERDVSRAVAPLVPADDAVEIDTSEITVAELVDQLATCVRDRLPESI